MKKDKTLLILAVIFAVLLVAAYFLYGHLAGDAIPDVLGGTDTEAAPPADEKTENEQPDTENTEEEKHDLAPDFTVYDKEGNPVKLSDFRGKPVVLNFWASWCGPCKSEMPVFENAYKQYGDEVEFLMVNLTNGSETVESAYAYIAQEGYTFPVYYDTGFDATGTYGVYSIPVTYFIDAEGYLIAQANGALNVNIMAQGLGMIHK